MLKYRLSCQILIQWSNVNLVVKCQLVVKSAVQRLVAVEPAAVANGAQRIGRQGVECVIKALVVKA